MRTVPDELAAHLAQSETTTAKCWRIIRNDSVTLGFTEHDRVLRIEGTDCAPAFGLEGGEVPARLGAQVETGEVLGILASAAISEDDILLGRYDGARVETWLVNWAAPEQKLLLRADTIGEIAREDGVFRAELRSPQQALNAVRGRLYQGLCDAVVGDARCGVDLDQSVHRGAATVLDVPDAFSVLVTGLGGFDEGWFSFGVGHWTSGQRNGLSDPVLTHRRTLDGDVLGFAAKVGDWVAVDDTLGVTVGCDRRFATCKERFGNEVNFRGFPHVPGSDFLLRHPRREEALDGRRVAR